MSFDNMRTSCELPAVHRDDTQVEHGDTYLESDPIMQTDSWWKSEAGVIILSLNVQPVQVDSGGIDCLI